MGSLRRKRLSSGLAGSVVNQEFPIMPIVSGRDAFLAELEQARVVCLTGSLGSGKTLLSHILAEEYLKKGYRLVTNTASIWADIPEEIVPLPNGQMKAVILLDEGGLYVRSFKSVQAIHTFARKVDTYIIFAGRKLPHSDLQEITLGLWFDFQKHFLLPIRVYKWEVEKALGKKYSGYIWLTGWSDYYGVYSTLDPGGYPGRIVEWFVSYTEWFFQKYGREYKLFDVATGKTSDEGQEIAAEFAGAAGKISSAVVSISKRKTRKW